VLQQVGFFVKGMLCDSTFPMKQGWSFPTEGRRDELEATLQQVLSVKGRYKKREKLHKGGRRRLMHCYPAAAAGVCAGLVGSCSGPLHFPGTS
jgi:hypothetical protein